MKIRIAVASDQAAWDEYVDAENWKYNTPGGPIKDESLKDLI